MERIGFIGVGNMGGQVAKAIVAKGYPLAIFDLDASACEKFKGLADIKDNANDVLKSSDIVFLSLPSSKQVVPTIESFISIGISGKIVIDTSTSYPLTTKELSEKVISSGGHLVDLPLSGAPADAEKGNLLALFGGEEHLYEQLRPVVSCFANRYAYLGGSGSGHITKLMFNFIALSYVNIYAMAFSLSEAVGQDNAQLLELLKTTGMSCGVLNFYGQKMIGKTYDMAFALELAHKDLSYVRSMFEEFQVPAFPLDGTLDMLRIAIRDGRGKEDYSASIATMYEFFDRKQP